MLLDDEESLCPLHDRPRQLRCSCVERCHEELRGDSSHGLVLAPRQEDELLTVEVAALAEERHHPAELRLVRGLLDPLVRGAELRFVLPQSLRLHARLHTRFVPFAATLKPTISRIRRRRQGWRKASRSWRSRSSSANPPKSPAP